MRKLLALAAGATIAGLLLTPLTGAANAYAAPTATKTVSYGAVQFTVPAAWPVIDLAKQPNTCVRLNQHAVYLGSPGADQQCPAYVRGRTEALIVETASGTTGTAQTVEEPAAQEIVATGSGVKVTAAYGTEPNTVRQILASASLVSTGPAAKADAVPNVMAPAVVGSAATDLTGQGFDPCSAPSGSAMSAWMASSPYRAIGVYIGGVNRSCAQPNLTASWVSQQATAGWKFIPLYLGLQASTQSCIGCTLITSPASDGTSAANDAADQATSLGLSGVVIYYDMESYGADRSAVALQFESAWTSQLHVRGFKSGIYSSASTGIADLANHYGSYVMPDVVDFASWPGSGSTSTSDPNIPGSEWANHQRIHQYNGGHSETYGGYTINIDQDYLDVQVSGAAMSGTVYHRLRHPDGSWTADGTLTLSPVSAVADAADGSGINNVVALKNGQVYHQQRLANTSWTGWGPVGTPGTGVATDIAASTDSAGNLQVAVIVNGQIWHVIRNASNGMWGTWGNLGSAPGGAVTSIAASIDNSHGLLNLVAIAGGQIYHIQRNNTTGNWGSWGLVGAPGSAAPLDITAATDGGGNLQVAAVTADGAIWHEIRLAFNGGWTGWQQIGNPAGTTITAATAAIDTTQSILQLAVIANGQVYHRVRNTDSSWGPWGLAGNPGTAVALAATIDPTGNFQLLTTY